MSGISYLKLNSGYRIPQLGLGTLDAPNNVVGHAVEVAIDLGYRHIDGAAWYENEQEVGEAIARGMKRNNLKREDVFVTSKLWCDKHAPEDVRKACELSVKNFGLKYLDLYLMHWPIAFHIKDGKNYSLNDPDTLVYEDIKFEDTWKAMEELVSAGLVKSIGVSNFNKRQIDRILKVCRIPPAVNQVEVNLRCLNTKLIDYCLSKNIQIEGYAPLGSPGFITGDQLTPLLEEPNVVEIARKHSKTPAQVLIRHGLQRGIIVLAKSVNPERVKSNLEVTDFVLTDAEMDKLNKIGSNKRFFDFPAFAKHPEYPFNEEY